MLLASDAFDRVTTLLFSRVLCDYLAHCALSTLVLIQILERSPLSETHSEYLCYQVIRSLYPSFLTSNLDGGEFVVSPSDHCNYLTEIGLRLQLTVVHNFISDILSFPILADMKVFSKENSN
jgi:hypothetical protein